MKHCQLYFIVLTVRTHDVQNHDTLEWLVNHIISFSQSVQTTYKTMTHLNGLSIVFYRSHSPYTQRTKPWHTWIACQSYFIVLTDRTRDVRNHDTLEWLVNRILSFSQSVHATYETMTHSNGLSIVFYHSRSTYKRRTKPWHTWMVCQSYFIILTVRTREVWNHDTLPPVWGLLRLAPIISIMGIFNVIMEFICLSF